MANHANYKVFLVLSLFLPKGVNIAVFTGKDVVQISCFLSYRGGDVSIVDLMMINCSITEGSLRRWKELRGVETDTDLSSSFKLRNSSLGGEVCETYYDKMPAASEAVIARDWRRPSCQTTRVPRVLSVRVSLSQSASDGIRVEHRLIADVELRLNSIVTLWEGRKHTKIPHLEDLPTSRFEHLESSRFALLFRLQSSSPQKIPTMTCTQSTRGGELVLPDVQNAYLSSGSPVETGVFINVHFTFVPYGSPLSSPAVIESGGVAPSGRQLRNNTMSKFKFGAAKLVKESPEDLEKPDDKDFPHYPFWSKIFSSFKHQFNSFRDQNNTGNVTSDSFISDMLYKFIIFMTILYKCLPRSKEAKKEEDNTIYFRILTRSFFLKWQNGRDPFSTGRHKILKTDLKELEHTNSKSPLRQTSMLNVLKDYVFRPWLLKAQPENAASCPNPSKSKSCMSFASVPCSSCCKHLNNFRAHNQRTIQVNPVRSFLPDPTCDPALDLAHVGYRLATLSTLPTCVPVSRIKLADAGFYFRGQSDEVTCYSCDARHSEWTREDNPMEIHRRLSPNCEHMLQRDRELSVLARSLNIGGAGAAGSGQESTRALGAEMNTPVEDGESSHPPAPASQETTPSSQRPVLSAGAEAGSSGRLAVPAAGNAATSARGAQESVPNAGTGHANTSTGHNGTPPGVGNNRTAHAPNTVSASTPARTPAGVGNNRTANAPNAAVSAATPATTDTRASTTSVSAVSGDGNTTRTSTAASNASSGPRSGGAEARPLFPRAELDLGGAVYPMYQDMASRRRTFSGWDDSRAPPLDHVILCGMFYAGYADCVRCFYCGVGLKHWVVTDDVWTEHVRWRPGCEYLRTIKGDSFISDTQRRLGIIESTSDQRRTDATNDNSAEPVPPAQGQQLTVTTTTSSSTSTNIAASTASWATTVAAVATATSSAVASETLASPAPSRTAARAASSGQTGGAAAALQSGTATAATSSFPSGRLQAEAAGSEGGGGAAERGASVTVVSAEAEDRERLVRLQAENTELSRRFQCKVCHESAIDTILMPCGHLVVCETCARSVTSCPLCHDTIRATARVHMG